MNSNNLEEIRLKIANLVEEYANHSLKPVDFVKGETNIPPSGKLIDSDEIKSMVEASLDGWLTTGRFNEKFENQLAEFLGVKHLLTVNSGSSANLVAFNTLTSPKLGKKAISVGDEVISVAAGFPTTINPILQFGCIPVFVDAEIGTYNIDVSKIENAISPKTKAIMLAHTLGNPFDLDAVRNICDKYGLWLIEDCCDALGSKYDGKLVGTFGDLATLSFYPAHHITMGEGGAVYTNNGKLRKIAESFRDWGRDCYCPPGVDNTCNNRFCWKSSQLGGSLPDGYDHKYIYSHSGYNLKITDMQAACGLAQLSKLSTFISKRKTNFDILYNSLKEIEEFIILPKVNDKCDPSWFGFPITIREDTKLSRNQLLYNLNEKKIGTRLLFSGNVTRQPYMKSQKYKVCGELNVTDQIMKNTFWIGLQPALTKDMILYSANSIKEIIGS
jgi:CDP-4-dehydro-6-deoxyglucose reductase, E1